MSSGPSRRSASCEVSSGFSPQVPKKIWKCQNKVENADRAILLARRGEVCSAEELCSAVTSGQLPAWGGLGLRRRASGFANDPKSHLSEGPC